VSARGIVVVMFGALTGCSSAGPASTSHSASEPPADAATMDAASTDGASTDGGGGEATPETSTPWAGPAAHPAMPNVVDYGGPVLSSPVVQPVVFAGDAMQNDIAAFTSDLVHSTYWTAVSHEYGVGAIRGLPVAVANETAPSSLTDAQVQSWIAAKITSGLLPAPDGNTVYAVFYPSGTTITRRIGTSCTNFYGYHGQSTSASRAAYVYAVLPRCHDVLHTDLANVTNSTSHELLEASTNPWFATAPAYASVDPAHAVWAIATGGATELGDMCALMPGAGYLQPSDLPYAVQRSWSNAAAAASHDPCVPAPSGPYFNAAPVLPDMVTISLGSMGSLTTQGVRIPVGQTRTIQVDLYSDAPTAGPWKVEALDLATLQNKPAALRLQLDATSGKNGDVLHLTITPLQAEPNGLEAFYVGSGLQGRSALWVGLVSNQ
jgi:hypothetical protein